MRTILFGGLLLACFFLPGCAVSGVHAGYAGAEIGVDFKGQRLARASAERSARQAKADLKAEYDSRKAALNVTIRDNQSSVKHRFFKFFVGEKEYPISTRSTCGCGQ